MSINKQHGFSLVELMVSITLGLILLAGVMSIFYSSKVTYLANEKNARLQENGRVALDFFTHDVRSAGYMGCARAVPFTSTLNNPNSLLWNYAIPLQGFEATGGAWAPAIPGGVLNPAPNPDSDVLVLRTLERDGRAVRVTNNLTALTSSPVVAGAAMPDGTVAMITDCTASSVFQVSGWSAGVVSHAVGGADPGNASENLGYLYRAGSRIAPLRTYIYYVADDPLTGEPVLYRKSGADPAEILIDGIQTLQVAYGEDTGGDRIADRYVPANAVGNWDRVLSVTISMLIRSDIGANTTDNNTYQVLPVAAGGFLAGPFGDLRQRMVFTTTIALRNRAQ